MKSSTAVGLLVLSSFSIMGICAIQNSGGDQPTASDLTWVAGQQGVYDPNNHQFVPVGSPNFNAVWAMILQQRRANQYSNGYSGGGYSGGYFSGGAHGAESGFADGGSARGGFGGFGEGFGGGHS